MQGGADGALFGLPVTIKDLTETAGIPTERGSYAWEGYVPTVDAPVVTRLAEAGAISLGKTTISEFAWTGVSWSPPTGITSNPWKDGYNAGASSAGAAAAAAAGYGPLHQGLGRRGLDPYAPRTSAARLASNQPLAGCPTGRCRTTTRFPTWGR